MFKISLTSLPLQDMDIILGMDWLSLNHVLIDCEKRIVLFTDSGELKVLFAQQVLRELKEGSSCFCDIDKDIMHLRYKVL